MAAASGCSALGSGSESAALHIVASDGGSATTIGSAQSSVGADAAVAPPLIQGLSQPHSGSESERPLPPLGSKSLGPSSASTAQTMPDNDEILAGPTKAAPQTSTTTATTIQTTTASTAAETTTAPTEPEPTPTEPEPAPGEGDDGLPSGEQWAALRKCEASGNYSISSQNGLYHGAYQFNQRTWDGVAKGANRPDLVGVNPAKVAPADQDAMAIALYRQRGAQPWPHCGKHLR